MVSFLLTENILAGDFSFSNRSLLLVQLFTLHCFSITARIGEFLCQKVKEKKKKERKSLNILSQEVRIYWQLSDDYIALQNYHGIGVYRTLLLLSKVWALQVLFFLHFILSKCGMSGTSQRSKKEIGRIYRNPVRYPAMDW